jgi:hypothetical protein
MFLPANACSKRFLSHTWQVVSVQRLGLKKPLMKNNAPKTYSADASSK